VKGKMTQNKQQNSVETMPPEIAAMLKECPALAEAARYGVDIPMLLDNLNRPISERIRRHQAALNAMNKLRNARFL
jgi:hypothetical protein